MNANDLPSHLKYAARACRSAPSGGLLIAGHARMVRYDTAEEVVTREPGMP